MDKELRILNIDPEFRDLIPPLTDEESRLLESSILENGCETPLMVWNGTVVDGHNRYAICQKHKLPFAIIEKNFADRGDVLLWIITNQLSRRNLTAYQKSELALRFEPLIREQARGRQATSTGGDKPQLVKNSAQAGNTADGKTRERLGKLAGVSHDTIKKVKKLSEAADDETKKKLRRGDVSIHKAYTELMLKERDGETCVCERCHQEKPLSAYNMPSKKTAFSTICRDCEMELSAKAKELVRPPFEQAAQSPTPTQTAIDVKAPADTQAPTQPLSSVSLHNGHPIHVAAPLPDEPEMFANVEQHLRFVVNGFTATAYNAVRLYTSGMASAKNTATLRAILKSANAVVIDFDEYVEEIDNHE